MVNDKIIKQDFFYITKLDNFISGNYYKITDKVTKRYCYATPKMLNEVLEILVKCINDGKYVLKNNFNINYKVYQIFLDKEEAEKRFKEYRNKHNLKQLKHETKAKIEWKLINFYLSKRRK